MARRLSTFAIVVGLLIGATARADAQRLYFERSYEVPVNAVLDVFTVRGKIDVSVGDPGRVKVMGTVTVRAGLAGLNVPDNALELARKAVANPPVEQEGNTIRLRPPVDDVERRAMTVSYQVSVPRDMQVRTVSESGATTVTGVAAHVNVRTQSAAISLRDLGGSAEAATGSGAVVASGVAGTLTVSTESSGITARRLGAGLRARTQSGAINVGLAGHGDVDVETSSSAIQIEDVRGGLNASTESGRVRVSGVPLAPWQVSTGSSSIELTFHRTATLDLEAASGSGNVDVDRVFAFKGSTAKGRATGAIGNGGPPVRCTTRSGSIKIAN